LTTTTGSGIGFVDSNVGRAIAFGSNKATALSSTLIDKCHISISRIGGLLKLEHIPSTIKRVEGLKYSVKGELVEKVQAGWIRITQSIGSTSGLGQSCKAIEEP
jgi:hypothetical protein